MQISRIRLSDKTSRLHPRHVVPKRSQADEPEVPVQVREWIGPALASSNLVLDAQPPAQPHSGVVVDRPIRFGDGAYIEVVRPSAQRAVQLRHLHTRAVTNSWHANRRLQPLRYLHDCSDLLPAGAFAGVGIEVRRAQP